MTVRRTSIAACAAVAVALPLALTAGSAASAAPEPVTPLEWQRTVLTTDVVDPTDLDVAADGSVVIAERTGTIKVWKQDGTLTEAGTIPVSANGSLTAVGEDELEEGGIHGLLLDRDFLETRRFLVHYSVPDSVSGPRNEGIIRVSSFVLTTAGKVDLASEKKLIDVPAEWEHCCHYGGDMERMADGTILLTTGDDTSPRDEGWNPRDKRPGREAFNAERTSQNKKDRRGKVLRFNPDGSVPADNPHVKDKAYDPYVYAMGFRSDYRMGHDPVTGATFVGNVGPDARTADESRGPKGHDELEIIPKNGGTNHGWPRCIADNKPYMDYDYETGETKGQLSCEGMTPAAVYYTYDPSAEFPLVAAGTRTHMAGPVYRAEKGALRLPDSFQGKLLHWDWSRSLSFATPVNDDGTLDTAAMTPWAVAAPNTFISVGPAVPAGGPAAAMEMAVGPDGALYVPEYGSGYYNNTNSAISRITCNGCTPSPEDYQGAAVDPDAGETQPAPTGCDSCSGGGTTQARPVPAAAEGVLAATGSPAGLATLAVLATGAAVLLRRRRAAAVADLSGL